MGFGELGDPPPLFFEFGEGRIATLTKGTGVRVFVSIVERPVLCQEGFLTLPKLFPLCLQILVRGSV
jgi:hypothetical protein